MCRGLYRSNLWSQYFKISNIFCYPPFIPSFPSLPPGIQDPIFAIGEAAKAAGEKAINGTVGIFLDEDGKPLLLPSVKKALEHLEPLLPKRSYSYSPLLGLPEFRESVARLIFGEDQPILASIATTGGTGAVAINLRLAVLMGAKTILLPTPAWANYRNLLKNLHAEIADVPYLQDGKAQVTVIADALSKAASPCAIILQVGCQNPTGIDWTQDQWQELSNLLKKHNAIALLDFAYQGFALGIDEDAFPIRLFAKTDVPTLIAWSASKNHSLYGERVGMACAVTPDGNTKREVEMHYMTITRSFHSGSAAFGQWVVSCVQENFQDLWLQDMAECRSILLAKREALRESLPKDLRASIHGNGMFALLPLTPMEIALLREKHSVFLTDDGRLNISGIPKKRLSALAEVIADVHHRAT